MTEIIRNDGWAAHNIWQHSDSVLDLYTKRARDETEEMTCAAQAAEILQPIVTAGETLLDVGCGTGWFFHSLRKRSIPVEYYGIDATSRFIEVGQHELVKFGLDKERLQCVRIEDLAGAADHVVCMNVLSNIDNYHRPLERLLEITKKTLILRESIKAGSEYQYVTDKYLNPGIELNVHVNAYDREEIMGFIRQRGFEVHEITDIRTRGKSEQVIDYPHYWTFLVAVRNK